MTFIYVLSLASDGEKYRINNTGNTILPKNKM